MRQEQRSSRSHTVPRDADIAAIVSLVAAIAVVGFWRLVG
jgi:hypothetical protein